MPKFKPGDRVKSKHTAGRSGVVVSCTEAELVIHLDDPKLQRCGTGPKGDWTARPCTYELETAEPVPQPEDWSYGEAERLHQAACAAIETYNAYIERKPTTNYLSAGLPSKW